MKKYKINIIILIIISFMVMYFALKDDFNTTIKYLATVNLLWIGVGILAFVLYLIFQSLSLHIFMKGIDKNYKLKDTILLILRAQFFNAITPFSSGGQPFQMYLMKKQGIKLTDSGNVLLQNFIGQQLSIIIMGTFSIVINKVFNIIPQDNMLRKIVVIGYVVNIVVLLILFMLSYAKKTNTELFNKILNFIFKFKFIRNKNDLKEKLLNKIDEFYEGSAYFKKNISKLFRATLYNVIGLVFYYIIPLFVFFSIGEVSSITILESIVCSGYTYLIGSFVPIPGGTGGLEYGFIQFFQGFTVGATLSACMILWRFITYYFGMIIGAISLLFYKRREEK